MSARVKRPSVLVVYDHPIGVGEMRVSIQQHLHAIDSQADQLDVSYYNSAEAPVRELVSKDFDAIILHNTFLGFRWTDAFFYTWKQRHDWLRQRDCLKIAMPQDEYDHAELLDEWLLEWGVTDVLTNFGPEVRQLLHPLAWPTVRFHRCLTGYIDVRAAKRFERLAPAARSRKRGLVYRARNLPYWFGSFGQQKHLVAEPVRERAEALGWTTDISTRADDAVVGEKWLDFLASGRCVLGSEGGSSVIDWRGEIRTRIRALVSASPEMTFDDVDRAMPQGWDDYRFATITPRHFEATITKTAQLLIEGAYDEILKPNVHYVPLRPDLSNLTEALARFEDDRVIADMVERTYTDVYLSGKWTYARLGELLAEIILGANSSTTEGAKRVGGIDLIERQLITAQHRAALLEAQLLEAQSGGTPRRPTEPLSLSTVWSFARAHRRLVFVLAALLVLTCFGSAVIGGLIASALVGAIR